MNRRVLVIEPDATVRRMIERALSSAGFAPISAPTIEASRAVLDGNPIEAAVVELRASNAEGTEGVRALRDDYPALPLIVTATLLTPRLMQELLRARVDDVISKPFTPRDLASAVQRVVRDAKTRREGAQEYAAAMAAARRAIVDGRLHDALAPLERARAASSFDAEAMALSALARELEGADDDAARGYRAAMALRDEVVSDDAFPEDGLARLEAYAGARVVPSFEHRDKRTIWFVSDPRGELRGGAPNGASVDVIVFALGLVPHERGATYARAGAERAFIVATSAMSDRLVSRIARTFDAPTILAHPSTAIDEARADVESSEA